MTARRGWIAAFLVLAAAPGSMAVAQADWVPTRQVEFVIPFGPGGGADMLARTLIRAIEEDRLVEVPIVPVNRGGGGTAVGVSYVKSAFDGNPNTLVLINPQTQLTPMQVPGAAGWRDLTPLINVMVDDYIFVARPGSALARSGILPARGTQDAPAITSVASAGTADDLAIELLQRASRRPLNAIRFNSGAEALTAVLGGHVDAAAGNPLEFLPYIRAGSVVALGVMRDSRLDALPEVPTFKEQGIDVAVFQMWRGVALPAHVPAEAVTFWRGVFERAIASPGVSAFLERNLATLKPIAGDDYVAFLEAHEAAYRELRAEAGTN